MNVYSTAQTVDWDALYADELPRVYNFFRYRVYDHQVAEDLTATTFERAWRSRNQYRRDRSGFSTWLFTIARNVAIDYYRRRRTDGSLQADLPSDAAPLDEGQQLRDDVRQLKRLLATLPPRERELIALKYGAGLTNRAIAQLVGLSETNVGTILHRVVKQLRTQWEQEL
ncbi:MAG: sigma-70 family RNA polymerase sigma factor [Anaerolineae bacterium]|nr:sigma-70 family RNA polymerase sigma factor [Anaerolineae bacterium]